MIYLRLCYWRFQLSICRIDPDNLTLFVRLKFTKPINLIGSYTAKGKVQVLPINGKGPCNITFGEYRRHDMAYKIISRFEAEV